MKNEISQIVANKQPQHIHREYSFSTDAFTALKNIQRRYSYELGQDVSTNMAVSIALLHYAQLMEAGKL